MLQKDKITLKGHTHLVHGRDENQTKAVLTPEPTFILPSPKVPIASNICMYHCASKL